MPSVPLPIANGFYTSDSLPISAQECVNWYPNIPQAPALFAETLFGTPGIEQLATTGIVNQVNRGCHVMAGIAYFVNGNMLFRLNRIVVSEVDTFTLDALGVVTGTGFVSMADNGTQLMILVPGGDGFIFVESPDTFTEITDLDFRANGDPQFTVFVDGYFLLTTDTKKFIISNINDGLDYTATDFGTAESDPDVIVAPVVFKNQVFIGGSETVEAFQNTGGPDFPFTRTNLFFDKGIFAPHSIVNTNQTFMFVGGGVDEGPAIWALQGNGFAKISTTAIDVLLSRLTDNEVSNILGWTYARKGAYFVGFTLPETAIVFDTITGRWHERKSSIEDDQGNLVQQRYRPNCMASAYGRLLVGDSVDGRIGSMDEDIYTEYDANIIRQIATQPFLNNLNSFVVPKLELSIENGVGNEAVVDPTIRMQISRDGGRTYGDNRDRALGKIGEYTRTAAWRRNGRMAKAMILRFTLSDAVKPVIIGLVGDILG